MKKIIEFVDCPECGAFYSATFTMKDDGIFVRATPCTWCGVNILEVIVEETLRKARERG